MNAADVIEGAELSILTLGMPTNKTMKLLGTPPSLAHPEFPSPMVGEGTGVDTGSLFRNPHTPR
jgi:hypothetical protein